MYADENVIKIKHAVLREVAKLAFEGTLDAQRDHIAVRLIPGPTPQFRCCIYKEREIIRQRVRLAEGKAPDFKALMTSTINVLDPIAPNGQLWIHFPQRIHLESSITEIPYSLYVIALTGHANLHGLFK